MHHLIVRNIEPLLESSFVFDSYSSRIGKGTHKGVERLKKICLKLTRNNTRTAWALKCDIRKFFDSIDHSILIALLRERVRDKRILEIVEKIVRSYETKPGKGVPLGNLTSQLFSNVYLNKLDQFVKRELRINHYLRYADDFVILDVEREKLERLVPVLSNFLENSLKLQLHPEKLTIRKIHKGIDFLGYVVYPTHVILRNNTKKRMLKKIAAKKMELDAGIISAETFDNILQSYLGMLTHCRGKGIKNEIDRITDDWCYLNFVSEAL
jgi:retron-type reverse transcriptase